MTDLNIDLFDDDIDWYTPQENCAQIIEYLKQLGSTGWAEYADTQYTVGSPFSVTADTDTTIPNNAGSSREGELPLDITSYYDESNSKIISPTGDGLITSIFFKIKPTTASATRIDVWLDIGSPVGEIYRQSTTLSKGQNIEHGFRMSNGGFSLDTWNANGAIPKINASAAVDMYDIRYVVERLHKSHYYVEVL